MSDRELIVRLLEAVERRIRRNDVVAEVARGLAIALAIPVLFKLLDLYFIFRTNTVFTFFVIWAVATAVWLVWRLRGRRQPLERVAAQLDREAQAQDQLKTAYWFIRHPKDSEWVDVQIRRAAEDVRNLRIEALYPSRIPRASWTALGLVLLLGVLNFLPLPWNYNWFYLQGAPAFGLTDAQKAMLEEAMELLRQAEELEDRELSEKLAEVVRQLQQGSMSQDQLSRSLSELQQTLAESNLDAGRIADGLERIARALQPSQLTRPTATELFALDINDAAAEVRELEKDLPIASPAALDEMAARFQEASEVAGPGLEALAKHMADAAGSMRDRNTPGAREALERTAQELERIQRALESQRLLNQASSELSELQDSVGGTPGEVGEGIGEEGEGEGFQEEGEGGEGQGGEGEGQGTGQGEGQGEGEGEGQGEGDGGEGQGGEGEGEGDGDDGGGRGGQRAGRSGPFPMRGEPTSLETALEKEAVPVRPTRGSRPETIEEASQRERSKLDYRNVPSNLTPAQKDLLNQDPIPWEKRQFIREYFETIRPQQ